MSEKTVKRAIAELQKSRLVKIIGQRSYPGKKPVNVYQINLKKLLKLAPVEERAKLEYTLEDDFLSNPNDLDRQEGQLDAKPGIPDRKTVIFDRDLGTGDRETGLVDPLTQSLNSPFISSENSPLSPCTADGENVEKPSPTEKEQNQPPQVATQQDVDDVAETWWALKHHAGEELTGEAFDDLFKTANPTEVLNVLTWLPNSINWDSSYGKKGVLKDFAEFCSLFPKIRKSYLRYLEKTPKKYHHKYIWKRQQA